MQHLTSLELRDYVTSSLNKITYKRFESYVINRLIHQLDDFSLKFITQQYVRRPDNKVALTDLYFPQLEMHVEIDEGHHFTKAENNHSKKIAYSTDLTDKNPHYIIQQSYEDRIRDEDIISITGHQIFRINVYKKDNGEEQSLDSINEQIKKLVQMIRDKKNILLKNKLFKPWDIKTEFSPITYIKSGEIKLNENVMFKRIVDACNCFGHSYKGFQKGGATHPFELDTLIWFPKLFKNDEWDNSLSSDGNIIIEKSLDSEIMKTKVREWNNGLKKRIVFAKVKHPLYKKEMYRFLGLYEMHGEANINNGAIWKRIENTVKTYPNK